MAKGNAFLKLFDAKPLLKQSRFRAGRIDARGVPAILLGVAAIVAVRGLTAACYKAASLLPDTLREARELLLAVRSRPQMLPRATVESPGAGL
jgi:hypothetical protein